MRRRAHGTPIVVPPVGGGSLEVFLAACEAIGADERLSEFRWVKTKRHLVRDSGDVRHVVYFQTSYLNAPGRLARLRVGVHVLSPSLGRWRSDRNRPGDDWLAGCYLSYLAPAHIYREWNVWGDRFVPSVTEVRNLLASYALPLFEVFGDDPEAMLHLPDVQLKALFLINPAAVVEWLAKRDRTDLVPLAFRQLPPEWQRGARQRFDLRRHDPNDKGTARSLGDTIFELDLAGLLRWS